MNYEQDPFVQEILADPHDDVRRLVYADWLEERGDQRGRFLRLEIARNELQDPHQIGQLERELEELSRRVDPDWIAVAGVRYDVVLMRADRRDRVALERLQRACRWSGLVTRRVMDQTPVKIMKSVSRVEVAALRQAIAGLPAATTIAIDVFPSPCRDYLDDVLEQADRLSREALQE